MSGAVSGFGNNSRYELVGDEEQGLGHAREETQDDGLVDDFGYDVKTPSHGQGSSSFLPRPTHRLHASGSSYSATSYSAIGDGEEEELHAPTGRSHGLTIASSSDVFAGSSLVGPALYPERALGGARGSHLSHSPSSSSTASVRTAVAGLPSLPEQEGSVERRTADAFNAIFTGICGLAAFFACGAMSPVLTFSATAIGVFLAKASGEETEQCPAALPATLAVASLVITIAGAKAFPFLPVLRHIVPLACNSYAVKLAVQLAWGGEPSSTSTASAPVDGNADTPY